MKADFVKSVSGAYGALDMKVCSMLTSRLFG